MAMRAGPDSTPGYVFCVRVGDHPTPLYRFVEHPNDAEPLVVDDTLACLDRARPPAEWDAPRELDDDAYRQVFDAWEIARNSIVQRWNHLADPANLAPTVPAVMRRAAEMVRNYATGLDIEEIDRVVEALEAPYAERILRLFRDALGQDTPAQQVELILQLVDELGLEPPPPPEPLPEINPDDVHLICWLALVRTSAQERMEADGDLA